MTSAPAPPTVSPDLAETAASLRLAVGRLARRTRQEATFGHSVTQLGILATLQRHGPTTLGELAAAERVAPPTITKAVAALVDDGLIEKRPDPDDGRIHRADLTAAGKREVREIRNRRDAWLASRMAELRPDEVARLQAVVPLLTALAEGSPRPDRPSRPTAVPATVRARRPPSTRRHDPPTPDDHTEPNAPT